MMTPSSSLLLKRLAVGIGWIARLGGTILVLRYWQHGVEEIQQFRFAAMTYGDRIYSVGFLAILLGVIVGWLSYRGGAALIIAGFLLAAGAPALGTCSRPELAADPAASALFLLPILIGGVVFAYVGRTRTAFA
jgi:hypothetical protein